MANNMIHFLSFIKNGLAANAVMHPDSIRLMKKCELDLSMNDNIIPSEPQDIILRGPGDIIGLNPAIIARIIPSANDNDFEPNYFPAIEFKDPDLPWRYSLLYCDKSNKVIVAPDRENKSNLLAIPWIALIVLEKGKFFVERIAIDKNQYAMRLTITDAKVLPKLNDLWAWAHVQISGELPAQKTMNELLADQTRTCSRLICPIRLEPLTLYTAFVVPAHTIGRQAGLGMEIEKTKDLWCAKEEVTFQLPIYQQWDFQTGETGDFEELATRINPAEQISGLGTREIDCLNPGFEHWVADRFNLEGVLVPVLTEIGSYKDQSYPFKEIAQKEIMDSLGMEDPPDGEADPLISIPAYGQHYVSDMQAKFSSIPPEQDNATWIHEINLDRRYRIAAALGTQVVQNNQEKFMEICWQQVGAIREANEALRQAKSGVLLSEKIKVKHFEPLSDQRFVMITQPFHHYYAPEGDSKNYLSIFNNTALSRGINSGAARRIVSQRVFRVNSNKITTIGNFDNFIENRLSPFNGQKSESRDISPKTEYYKGSVLKADIISVTPIGLSQRENGSFIREFRNSFDVRVDIVGRLKEIIKEGEHDLNVLDNLKPIMRAPQINFPMVNYLRDLSFEYMIPNLDKLQNNTTILFKENRNFIESYLVGLNHEMSRELLWREYPTDCRGTMFSYFWEPLVPEVGKKDINDIHTWGNSKLGVHSTVDENSTSIIFGIKADLIRRYPDAAIFAVKINNSEFINSHASWRQVFIDLGLDGGGSKSGNAPEMIKPNYLIKMGSDTLFLVFPIIGSELQGEDLNKYFFVIAQTPSLPVFGLDESKQNDSDTSLSIYDLSWDHVKIKENSCWIDPIDLQTGYDVTEHGKKLWPKDGGNTSASLAKCLMQVPVRIVIPAIKLLPKK